MDSQNLCKYEDGSKHPITKHWHLNIFVVVFVYICGSLCEEILYMRVFGIYQPQHGPLFRLPGGAMHAMYRYSPRSDSWSLITRLGERASCAIASCNNKLFITGGRDNKNQVISTVMCWDVDRGVLTEECALPMGVSHHGSVTLMKSYTHIHRITPAPASQ